MKGVYEKTIIINIDENIKWFADDSNNTIRAECNGDIGVLVPATDVLAAMPAFGTFSNKIQVIQSWYKEAAKLSLNITDDDIEI